ncbi:ABC transporter substrate-binding protein [Tepidibacter hydrothermalis]|uniref:ABC transporter substrate-binding protein n=1 Tax=Tepidibacter hydrothermalis TaxID=3036126 RepID=A0ABY8EHM6_9FIRM|nr:ABC transporter substrate-binding protein [Tepidibacter hydrothermalis]WFD10258.1 ABC transporter substrate-binding protein [Tepidibacter hydrothermalis]
MNKKFLALGLSVFICLSGLVGCNSVDTNEEQTKKQEQSVEESLKLDFVQTSRHDDSVNKFSMVYDIKPNKSLAVTNAMIEMMLSLGLEDKMAGTSYAENNVLESLKPAYEKVPVMSKTYPSKEQIIANGVDFIIGWGGDFNDKGVGSIDWLNENNIKAYIPRSVESNATVDSIYEDFDNLGKIFDAEDKAEEVNNKIKAKLEEVNSKISNVDKKVKVMGYDSATNGAVVIGKGINNEIIKLAQGENIFGDIDKAYPEVTWEEVVKRNPDVMIVLEYSLETGGQTFEQKVKELKENPALQNINAIKNNRFIKLELVELYPGERVPLTVEKLAKEFYPENF